MTDKERYETLAALWFTADDLSEEQKEAAESAAATAARATGLKPFPITAVELMRLLESPDFKMAQVAAVAKRDPALTSRLLSVANSALYRRAVACTSIDQALSRLGSRTVRQLVAALTTVSLFKDAGGYGQAVRKHCVGVAAVTSVLSLRWVPGHADEAFLCGLMHDVGKLLLMQSEEFPYEQAPDEARRKEDEMCLFENDVLGFDHAIVGGYALGVWGLPALTAHAITAHHHPTRAYAQGGDLGLMVALLRVADRLEYRLGAASDSPSSVGAFRKEWAEELAGSDAFVRGKFDIALLESLWPRIIEARSELLKLL